MQKQFAVRDWILYSLLSLLVLLLILAMYQIDRQWLKLTEMETSLSEQAKSMRELRLAISAGNVAPTTQQTASDSKPVSQVFKRAQAASQLADYAPGDWNVEALRFTPKSLTPFIENMADTSAIQNYVLESLLTTNPDTLEWQGLIAKSWQVSADGLQVTFQLRDDVSFSDGVPLTAEDVVFTHEFTMNPAIQAPVERAFLDKIKQVKATGKYEVVFTLKEPYFRVLSLTGGSAILPKHFYEPYLKQPQKYNESKGLLLGSGPYKLPDPQSWTPDKGHVELVRNEHYWGDVQPSFNRILWKVIQNDSARLTTYRNGDIDTYTALAFEYQNLVKDPQIMAKSQSYAYMPQVTSYFYIGWNQAKGGKPTRFADKKVRQAMSYLSDVDRVIKDIYFGYAEPAVTPFNKRSKQHDSSLQAYTFDVEKAKSLLKQAGYEDRNSDGVLEDKAGQPFEFKLTYPESSENSKRMVMLFKDLYAKAGVKLIPFPQEGAMMTDILHNKDFDAVIMGWGSHAENDLFQAFHSSQAQTNGDNFVSYKNPQLDKLIDQVRGMVDENQRMPIWQQAERIIYDDQPYTFLIRRQELLFVDKRIANVQMTNSGLNLGGLPLENYVPAAQQKYTQ